MTETGSKPPAWLALLAERAADDPGAPAGRAVAEAGASEGHAVAEPAAPGGRAAGDAGPTGGHAVQDEGIPSDGRSDGAGVEAALSLLGRLNETPVAEHVGVFEGVLTGLEAVLASVDEPVTDPRQ
ncbi:hypothetical protein N5079_21750 [Planotetraspora sp. A-T 1434]|uniref:hypothetical protein n=1 Tax=Planotetraspora sp. A-T 1434 TaxID=2979219 RepID=UPI0021C11B38|nr:hypothetical protein [Planotetraspora sp. A-T 1434]MCT9932834.1 hypothetical protein [Planotetraspora sp. A-T 1434]